VFRVTERLGWVPPFDAPVKTSRRPRVAKAAKSKSTSATTAACEEATESHEPGAVEDLEDLGTKQLPRSPYLKTTRERVQVHLNARVPDDLKYVSLSAARNHSAKPLTDRWFKIRTAPQSGRARHTNLPAHQATMWRVLLAFVMCLEREAPRDTHDHDDDDDHDHDHDHDQQQQHTVAVAFRSDTFNSKSKPNNQAE